jgi:hypothetical protein
VTVIRATRPDGEGEAFSPSLHDTAAARKMDAKIIADVLISFEVLCVDE